MKGIKLASASKSQSGKFEFIFDDKNSECENHFIDFQSEKSISPMSSPPLSENLKVNEMEREITNMREEINILYEKIDMLTNEVKTLREINRESEPVFFEMSDI
jgi:hypothetical protein